MRTALAAAGGPGPDELAEWLAAGFSSAQARGWLADGAELSEAQSWRTIGLAESRRSLAWRVRGVGPGEARLLEAAGVVPDRRARRRLRRRTG